MPSSSSRMDSALVQQSSNELLLAPTMSSHGFCVLRKQNQNHVRPNEPTAIWWTCALWYTWYTLTIYHYDLNILWKVFCVVLCSFVLWLLVVNCSLKCHQRHVMLGWWWWCWWWCWWWIAVDIRQPLSARRPPHVQRLFRCVKRGKICKHNITTLMIIIIFSIIQLFVILYCLS